MRHLPPVPGARQLTLLWPYLVVFGVAVAVTFALTPLCRRVAVWTGAVVRPTDRGVHERPTPHLGGVAMFAGLGVGMWAASLLPPLREGLQATSEWKGVIFGGAVMACIGLLDDLRDVSAPAKMAGQILAASVMSFFGITMVYFRIPFWEVVVLGRDLAPLATIVWVVLMTNAINAIDGLDGLAAGVVGLASIAFFIFSFGFLRQGAIDELSIGPLIAAVTAGVAIGFLPWNWHPARIFMGDAGAYLLGILMAASTIVVGGRTPERFPGKTFFFFAPLVVPLVILGVAVFDAGFAVLRRVATRRSWHAADKEHLHHRLLRRGHGHKRAVLTLYAWTAMLAAVVLVPSFVGASSSSFPLLLGGVALGFLTFFRPGGRGPDRPTRRARRAARRAIRQSA